MHQSILIPSLLLAAGIPARAQLDQNANQFSDIWETHFQAAGLVPASDSDGDGLTNDFEHRSGTDPLDRQSRLEPGIALDDPGGVKLWWSGEAGKRYNVFGSTSLQPGSWQMLATASGAGAIMEHKFSRVAKPRWFFSVEPLDADSDGDGLTDWEEGRIGFDPLSSHSGRHDTADFPRAAAAMNAVSIITAGLVDGDMREDWPDKGVIAIRRAAGIKPVWVNVTFGGTAVRGTDYTANVTGVQVYLPFGASEAWVELTPANDSAAEGVESITVTVEPGADYAIGTAAAVTATLGDASPLPSAKAAARFLIQAAFGPDQDSAADPDQIPENVEELMSTGFESWIDGQFARPAGLLQPYTEWAVANANGAAPNGNFKEHAWWERAMGVPRLRPDAAATVAPDPLRQRMAFALSEILVTSDRPETLAVDYTGMANYYDTLVQHAFGNYRDLLHAVALHPVMGIYLSHLGNQKANPALNIHPDENFAREIMQLFTIGLWELNMDGTRKLHPPGHPHAGQPIPSYTNADITEMARVFTGLTWHDSTSFNPNNLINGDRLHPMKMYDAWHDLEPKTLPGGTVLPARTASPGSTGTAGYADISAAVTALFNHPNTPPFLARLLIQRFVTSNPSPAYIQRVAQSFANNGSGIRGDLKAVLKAILLDPEARDPAMMDLPAWGKLREPFLRVVNLARAFNASSASGRYGLDQYVLDHMQDPMNSPSVFNFFLPGYSPPGVITTAGLVAPEFQLLNATSSITAANYFYNALGNNDLHRWGSVAPNTVRLNLDPELALIVPAAAIGEDSPAVSGLMDSDALLRRLDLVLTGGTLTPRQFQIIRESISRIRPPDTSWQWHRERLRLAITLIVTSADFNVLR